MTSPSVERTVIAIPLAFPETDVDDAKAVIYRTGKEEIILVNPDFSTPETLAASFALLKELRKERVDDGLTEASVVAGFSVRRPMKSQKRDAFTETLEEISDQPVSTIGNLGPGRWVMVPRGFGQG